MKDFDKIDKKNNFKVPEHYFDNFEENFEKYLKLRAVQNPKTSIFQKLKPYIYAAACFLLMFFVGNIIVEKSSKNYNTSQAKKATPDTINDFNLEQYYSDYSIEDYNVYEILENEDNTDLNSENVNEYLSQVYSDYELLNE